MFLWAEASDSSIFPDEEGTESGHDPAGRAGPIRDSSIFPDEEGTESQREHDGAEELGLDSSIFPDEEGTESGVTYEDLTTDYRQQHLPR